MTRRLPTPLAAIGVAGLVASLVVYYLTRNVADEGFAFRAELLIPAAALIAVGWVVARNRPSNPIGWLFGTAGGILAWPTGDFVVYWAGRTGTVPRWVFGVAVIDEASWVPLMAILGVYLPLLFPNGRPTSPRWWIVGIVAAAGAVGGIVGICLGIEHLEIGASMVANPFLVDHVAVNVLEAAPSLLLVSFLGASASVVYRFRRSRGDERQQLKWFAYAVVPLPFVAYASFAPVPPGPLMVGQRVVQVAFPFALAGVAVSAGVAILRYRLYEIDRIIKRTVVYGAVTALLAACYAVSVFVFGLVSRPLTGQSDIAVAAATLATVAGFGPLRRRVQTAVDRRFDRGRYDAARTIEAFGVRLREEVDLAALQAELARVVSATMRPAAVHVWLSERT